MPGRLGSFLAELKRRHVYQVAAVYVAVGLGVLGAAELILDPLGLEGLRPAIVVLTLLGLPLAVVLAWAYERTPGGIVRDPETTSEELRTEDPSTASTTYADRSRLAILPLANIHADREQDYFADGMTEELISVISRIQGLDVIARTSVMAYKDTTKSVSEIGRELNVGTVLEGSVRKAGDQLRITVQLIDAATQGHLWSQDYDREFREVFQVQSDIARNVADALKVTLLRPAEESIGQVPTVNLQAYDLYLLGRHHFNKRTSSGLHRAIEYFHQAIDLDPDFALAFVGLAEAYVYAGHGFASIPDALDQAKKAAARAIHLDEALPEAHRCLGYVALFRDWDLGTAEREIGRAIQLNPSDAQAHQSYAHVAIFAHRFDDAAEHMQRALELDPLSVVIQNESGWAAFFMGHMDEALECFRRANSMDDSYAMAHYNMGNAYEGLGQFTEAIACYRRAVELSDRSPLIVSGLGAALARDGNPEEARKLLNELDSQATEGAGLFTWRAAVHDALGEKDKALDCLERAVAAREPVAMQLDTRHFFFEQSLGGEPRYERLRNTVHETMGI